MRWRKQVGGQVWVAYISSEPTLVRARWLARRTGGVEVVREALAKVRFALLREGLRRSEREVGAVV